MSKWLESHTVLKRHRKVRELALALRVKRVYVLGHLHALWHEALEQQEDGDLTQWSDGMIAEAADFEGDAPQFVSLLQSSGFLDGRLLHDWLDYAGKYLTSRYKTRDRDRLVSIWAKHGRLYGKESEKEEEKKSEVKGKQVGSEREVKGKQVDRLPYRTDRTGPTGPNLPNPPNRTGTEKRGPVESSDWGKAVAAIAEQNPEEARLLGLRWNLGEHRGKTVIELPTEYARWALKGDGRSRGLNEIGQEYRDALAARLRLSERS